MAGINKDVHIFGLTFHVQTELLTTNQPIVHTVVFRSGRAIAARDREVSPEELAEKGERNLVLEQQDAVIASLRDRARKFQAKKSEAPLAEESSKLEEKAEAAREAPPPPPEPAAPVVTTEVAPPAAAPPRAEELSDVLRTRRMLGELRQRLNIPRAEAKLVAGARIEHAARCFDWILEHRLFHELRVFEQVQFHVIRTRITSWSAAGSQPAQAEAIWSEVKKFFDHLGEINHREDLMGFDRRLLEWGMAEIERRGPSEEIRDELRQLSGFDPELDEFLGGPASSDKEAWRDSLGSALARLNS